jgi:ACS family hexuronate transporter-like MFS transporter
MCICAAMMPMALLAVRAENPYLAIACICIATLGHQSWSANLLTLPADLFPKRQVASAFGFAGSAGAWGGVVFTFAVGKMIDSVGYIPVFTIAGLMHVIAAVVVVFLITKPAEPGQNPVTN